LSFLSEHWQAISAIIGAATSFLVGIFGYLLKKEKEKNKNWSDLMEDSASYRDEVRNDLGMLKKERGNLKIHISDLEGKINDLICENIKLKAIEMSLQHQVDILKRKLNGESK
jgi:hypothetical protein